MGEGPWGRKEHPTASPVAAPGCQHVSVPAPAHRATASTQPTQALGDALSPAHLPICPPRRAGGLQETLGKLWEEGCER